MHLETKGRNLMFYDLRNKTITLLIRDQTKIYFCMGANIQLFYLFHKFILNKYFSKFKTVKKNIDKLKKKLSIVLILSHTDNFFDHFYFQQGGYSDKLISLKVT